MASKGLVRAIPLKNFLVTALSTTASGTAYSVGPATTGQKLYGAMHLTCASTGRTLAMLLQSATASGFATPTTRFTFGMTSFEGSTWGAPIANLSTNHSWWRASWTLSTAASTAGTWKGLVWMGLE